MNLMIKQERQRRGWTLAKAAKRAGLTKAAYRNIESGIRKPSYDVLLRLLTLYEYEDPRKLFGELSPTIEQTPGGNRANAQNAKNKDL